MNTVIKMDLFKREQYHYLGIGGFTCRMKCCNHYSRKGKRKRDKALNRMARSRMKANLNKEIQKYIPETHIDVPAWTDKELLEFIYHAQTRFNEKE